MVSSTGTRSFLAPLRLAFPLPLSPSSPSSADACQTTASSLARPCTTPALQHGPYSLEAADTSQTRLLAVPGATGSQPQAVASVGWETASSRPRAPGGRGSYTASAGCSPSRGAHSRAGYLRASPQSHLGRPPPSLRFPDPPPTERTVLRPNGSETPPQKLTTVKSHRRLPIDGQKPALGGMGWWGAVGPLGRIPERLCRPPPPGRARGSTGAGIPPSII